MSRRLGSLRLLHLAPFCALFSLRWRLPLLDTRGTHRLVRTLNPLPLLARLVARDLTLLAWRLRPLAMLTDFRVPLLPVLIDRGFALLTLLNLASLMLDLSLLLALANLSVALLSHPICERVPIENRALRRRRRFSGRSLRTERTIRSLAEGGHRIGRPRDTR
jgi:hypothetical protein